MSKKDQTVKSDLVTLSAFCAMAIAAFMYIFSGVINWLVTCFENIKASAAADVLVKIVSIGTLVGNIALIIAVALPARRFVKYRSLGWRVCYWVFLIVFALGVVLNMLGGLLNF